MKKSKLSFLIILLIALFLSACDKSQRDLPASTPDPVTNETISLVAVGDNLLHMPVINSGKQADGTYDYSHLFSKLQPIFKDADLAVIGQETVFGGAHLGYSGYPLFNSPSDMGKTLVNEGFDIVLHASNHVLDKWASGIENTLKFWEDYPQITVLGINKNAEDKQIVDIIDVKGAKIAVLNYTYGTNGLVLPAGKQYLVNYIDSEKIKQDALFAEENADFTIAFMHWGTEYSNTPDDMQKNLCKDMCEWGVDLVIGAHPHVIQPVEWYTGESGNQMLVYYSLGNYVSRQLEARNLLGGLANIELKHRGDRVYIHDYSFMPIVTHYNTAFSDFAVYALKDYNDALAAGHGVASRDGAVSVKRWRDMVESVFEGYESICVDY